MALFAGLTPSQELSEMFVAKSSGIVRLPPLITNLKVVKVSTETEVYRFLPTDPEVVVELFVKPK